MLKTRFIITIVIFLWLSPAYAFNSMTMQVHDGDTLSDILQAADISSAESKKAITALSKIYDPASLKVGQKIKVGFSIQGKKEKKILLSSVQIYLSKFRNITIYRERDGSFTAEEKENNLSVRLVKASAEINSTLFSAARRARIPNDVMMEMIRNYSYDVDFQRDIRKGNRFTVLYEQFYDDDGVIIGSGNTIFSSLKFRNRTLDIYRFETLDGEVDYYDENGQSIRKSFLRTPVDGARITSSFGQREHPILGYTKMHKGIDFGAPTGTPVYAAGDGFIDEARMNGSYGNYVKIRHDGLYSTAYAHLNNFARDIIKGRKIKQGQIIGYVGTTGRSTGPHLHYEILKSGNQINPLSIKTTPSRQLKNLEYGMFDGYKRIIERLSYDMDKKAKVKKKAKS